MLDVVTIAGSPSAASRSAAVLDRARTRLEERGLATAPIAVRDLPPQDLVWGRLDAPAVRHGVGLIAQARGVVVATPVYKTAYSGVLKAFLDLLPTGSLAGKTVLPIATGGSLAHLLALEYALKPVLSALGARHVLAGVYVLDADLIREGDGGDPVGLVDIADGRLAKALDEFEATLPARHEALVLQELAV
jgi:FMN reductase